MYLKKIWKTALLAVVTGAVLVAASSAGSASVEILKAKGPIKKGQRLTQDMFETVELNKSEGWMVQPDTPLDNLTASRDIAADEFLSKHDLSAKQVVTFAPHEREFTVQTDLSRCVGGDLATGDLAEILFYDKATLTSLPLFRVMVLEVDNRSGLSINGSEKEVRDMVPATVKIKVTTEQAAALLAFEQRGLVAFARIPDEVAKELLHQ